MNLQDRLPDPSWIGDDGLKYRTYCYDCESHHEGDECEPKDD